MKRDSAITLLRSIRDTAEMHGGKVLFGKQGSIALVWAADISGNKSLVALAAVGLIQDAVGGMGPSLYEELRGGYKALEALPATAEFKIENDKLVERVQNSAQEVTDLPKAENPNGCATEAPTQKTASTSDAEFEAFMKKIGGMEAESEG